MRRRRKTGRVFLILLLAAALACFILLRFVFIVRSVEVAGDPGAYAQEGVVRAANVGFGTSIFRVDEETIRSRVNATGALRAEGVQLQYPDTVRITVSRRTPIAMVLHMGKLHVLDEEACVIESLGQVPDADLVYISGMRVQGSNTGEVIRADEAQLNACCAVLQALKNQAAAVYVSELNLGDSTNLQIITRTGITVRLGDSGNMQDKIAWMKGAVQDLESRGEYGGTLDVSSGTKADYRSGAIGKAN